MPWYLYGWILPSLIICIYFVIDFIWTANIPHISYSYTNTQMFVFMAIVTIVWPLGAGIILLDIIANIRIKILKHKGD